MLDQFLFSSYPEHENYRTFGTVIARRSRPMLWSHLTGSGHKQSNPPFGANQNR